MTDYCDVEFSWQSNKNTNLVVAYSVVDKNQPSESISTPKSFCNHIELITTDNSISGDGCQLTIACKSLYKVAISRIEVISESRILELYDLTKGYLCSARGVVLPFSECQRLLKIEYNFEDPVRSFYGMFKSLPRKNVFQIVQLKIVLSSCDNELYCSRETNSINVPKLKTFVAELGDGVPENAKSLLEAMEQYQKNKTSTVDDIKKQLCQESMGQNQSLATMTKMMSTFSQLHSQTTNSDTDSQNKLLSMISSVQNGNKNDSEGMYQFLQNICGQVSEMRIPPKLESNIQIKECEPVHRLDESSASGAASEDTDSIMDTKLEQMEKQVLSQVDKKINALEERLTSKLDLILQGLNIQVPKQTETHTSGQIDLD